MLQTVDSLFMNFLPLFIHTSWKHIDTGATCATFPVAKNTHLIGKTLNDIPQTFSMLLALFAQHVEMPILTYAERNKTKETKSYTESERKQPQS